MKDIGLKSLAKKYIMIAESQQANESPFGSEPGSYSAGGEMSSADASTKPVENNVTTALDWQLAGLYEPETPEATKQTEAAIKELDNILNGMDKALSIWSKKHTKLGAEDTVSKEQLAQYIAKSRLVITKLD